MPSISQARLDEMTAELAEARREATECHSASTAQYARVARFDSILEKVINSANGQSLASDFNRGGFTPGYAMNGQLQVVSPCGHTREATEAERHEAELRGLNARIVYLECRVAAVIAVATFAKEHKA